MKFKTLMIIKAIVCLVLGIPILFFPEFLYGLFGIQLSGVAQTYPAREYGAALFGNLLLAWIGRNAEDSIGRTAIIWALFIYDAIGFVVTLILALSGQANALIWGPVLIYLLIALGFGYFLLKPTAP